MLFYSDHTFLLCAQPQDVCNPKHLAWLCNDTYTQLVESSCQPETPQCFLLTPKLLPGLPMGDGITILNIMNGPSIDSTVITASNR